MTFVAIFLLNSVLKYFVEEEIHEYLVLSTHDGLTPEKSGFESFIYMWIDWFTPGSKELHGTHVQRTSHDIGSTRFLCYFFSALFYYTKLWFYIYNFHYLERKPFLCPVSVVNCDGDLPVAISNSLYNNLCWSCTYLYLSSVICHWPSHSRGLLALMEINFPQQRQLDYNLPLWFEIRIENLKKVTTVKLDDSPLSIIFIDGSRLIVSKG